MRLSLQPDCARCAALCCVAPAFDASDEFALDKPAGVRCPNLDRSNLCRIHAGLVPLGFSGCAAFDCHGAGQRATERFGREPERLRHEAFLALLHVHEALWLVAGGLRFCPAEALDLRAALEAELARLEALADLDARELVELDLGPRERSVRELLRRVREASRQ